MEEAGFGKVQLPHNPPTPSSSAMRITTCSDASGISAFHWPLDFSPRSWEPRDSEILRTDELGFAEIKRGRTPFDIPSDLEALLP